MLSIFKLGFVVSFITAIGCGKVVSPAPACPARYKEVPADQQKGDLTCSCTASATGTVWGRRHLHHRLLDLLGGEARGRGRAGAT